MTLASFPSTIAAWLLRELATGKVRTDVGPKAGRSWRCSRRFSRWATRNSGWRPWDYGVRLPTGGVTELRSGARLTTGPWVVRVVTPRTGRRPGVILGSGGPRTGCGRRPRRTRTRSPVPPCGRCRWCWRCRSGPPAHGSRMIPQLAGVADRFPVDPVVVHLVSRALGSIPG